MWDKFLEADIVWRQVVVTDNFCVHALLHPWLQVLFVLWAEIFILIYFCNVYFEVLHADNHLHCLPYFPLLSVTPNIKSFFMESELYILCPKYSNLLILLSVWQMPLLWVQYQDSLWCTVSLKHVELYIKIKLRNSASCWLLLYQYIMMQSSECQNKSLNSDLSEQCADFKTYPRIIILFSAICE